MIHPKDLIDNVTVEELCLSAEKYFQSKPELTSITAKPFNSLDDAPLMLQYLGHLLSGLHLRKGMTIVDFGSGACWLSRYLNQLQCRTISCDPSETALEIGKNLFKEYPVMGGYSSEPVFLPFNGHTIDLPDNAADRIICYDAFHHVPNQGDVLSEFYRILKDEGIVGFSEPGRFHSQSPEAQKEMKDFKVLENDINIEEIFTLAEKIGFSDISLRLLCDMDLSLKQAHCLTRKKLTWDRELKRTIFSNIKQEMTNHTLFFLYKGNFTPDSKARAGLSHAIKVDKKRCVITPGKGLVVSLKILNSGKNKWLHETPDDIGTVRIGTHLYGENNQLLSYDFTRHPLPKTILPGETINQTIAINFTDKGRYNLVVDLVSENICWFEDVGSKAQLIHVDVK